MAGTDVPPPLVSVYLPTKDRLSLLRRAVASVLSQDYENLELIVVDDGSTDGSRDYLRLKAAEDPRLRFRLNEHNLGACHSRNLAIATAEGEFITGLDDDDYFLPSHLSTLVRFWPQRRQGVVALFPNAFIVDAAGRHYPFRHGKAFRSVERRRHLLAANRIGSQLFLERKALLAVGGFDPAFPAWQDLECWYRLLGQNGAAECTGAYTYVVDVGHGFERITTSGRDRIRSAYEQFVAKHPLPWLERQLLYANHRACALAFRNEGPLTALGWRAYHRAIRVLF